jgi:hypothetical protein
MADPVEVPTGPLVDLELAKIHLKVFSADDDALIALYIAAASDDVRARHVFAAPVPAAVQAAVLLKIEELYDPALSDADVRASTIANLLRVYSPPKF